MGYPWVIDFPRKRDDIRLALTNTSKSIFSRTSLLPFSRFEVGHCWKTIRKASTILYYNSKHIMLTCALVVHDIQGCSDILRLSSLLLVMLNVLWIRFANRLSVWNLHTEPTNGKHPSIYLVSIVCQSDYIWKLGNFKASESCMVFLDCSLNFTELQSWRVDSSLTLTQADWQVRGNILGPALFGEVCTTGSNFAGKFLAGSSPRTGRMSLRDLATVQVGILLAVHAGKLALYVHGEFCWRILVEDTEWKRKRIAKEKGAGGRVRGCKCDARGRGRLGKKGR